MKEKKNNNKGDKPKKSPLWLMIRQITLPDLQQFIFEKVAKAYKIDWGKIEYRNLDLRADQIHAEILELQKQYPSCYLDLYSSLRIINLAAVSKNIMKIVTHLTEIDPAKKYFFTDMFNLEHGGQASITHPANRVAWFCARQDKLESEWGKIVDLAVNEEQKNSSWSYYTIEPAKNTEQEEIDQGIESFKEKFGKAMEDSKKMPFPVEVHPFPSTGKYVRYAITVPKDPFKTYLCDQHNVTVGLDPTMHTFYLDHYIAKPTIRLTWPVVCDERVVADFFVEHVLGTKIVDEPTMYFTKPLRTFTSSRTSEEAMKVDGDDEKEQIHSIFISSVDFTYAESESEAEKVRRLRENKKRAKRGEEQRPAFRCYNYKGNRIWAYLDEHFNPTRYKPEWRDILSITFTVRLFKVVVANNVKIYDREKTRDFKIVCKPDKLTYSPRMQDIVEPEYKATLRYIVEKKLKLIGEPLAAHVADAREEGTDGSIL